jgi:hypothetical protein
VSSAEENMALAWHLMEARVEGDLHALDEMLAPTSSATLNRLPANLPAARAKNGRSPNSMLPSLTAAYTSRTR